MNTPEAPHVGPIDPPETTLDQAKGLAQAALDRIQNSTKNERLAAGAAAVGVAAGAAAAVYAAKKSKPKAPRSKSARSK